MVSFYSPHLIDSNAAGFEFFKLMVWYGWTPLSVNEVKSDVASSADEHRAMFNLITSQLNPDGPATPSDQTDKMVEGTNDNTVRAMELALKFRRTELIEALAESLDDGEP